MAGFRVDAARAADRAEFDALARDLSRVSPEFARFWSALDVDEAPEGSKRIVHPDVGEMTFERVALAHTEPNGSTLRVTLYAPKAGVSTTRARTLFDLKS